MNNLYAMGVNTRDVQRVRIRYLYAMDVNARDGEGVNTQDVERV